MSLVKCVQLDVVEASRSPGDLTQTSRYLLSFSVPFTTKQRGAGPAIDGTVPGNRRNFVFCGSIRRGAVKERWSSASFPGAHCVLWHGDGEAEARSSAHVLAPCAPLDTVPHARRLPPCVRREAAFSVRTARHSSRRGFDPSRASGT